MRKKNWKQNLTQIEEYWASYLLILHDVCLSYANTILGLEWIFDIGSYKIHMKFMVSFALEDSQFS